MAGKVQQLCVRGDKGEGLNRRRPSGRLRPWHLGPSALNVRLLFALWGGGWLLCAVRRCAVCHRVIGARFDTQVTFREPKQPSEKELEPADLRITGIAGDTKGAAP
jgi:hypothetical protein